MAHTLKSKTGRAIYKVRKQTVEPVFGIIKSAMGFRQFSVRGLDKVAGEWTLVCLTGNLKRMASLRPKFGYGIKISKKQGKNTMKMNQIG